MLNRYSAQDLHDGLMQLDRQALQDLHDDLMQLDFDRQALNEKKQTVCEQIATIVMKNIDVDFMHSGFSCRFISSNTSYSIKAQIENLDSELTFVQKSILENLSESERISFVDKIAGTADTNKIFSKNATGFTKIFLESLNTKWLLFSFNSIFPDGSPFNPKATFRTSFTGEVKMDLSPVIYTEDISEISFEKHQEMLLTFTSELARYGDKEEIEESWNDLNKTVIVSADNSFVKLCDSFVELFNRDKINYANIYFNTILDLHINYSSYGKLISCLLEDSSKLSFPADIGNNIYAQGFFSRSESKNLMHILPCINKASAELLKTEREKCQGLRK